MGTNLKKIIVMNGSSRNTRVLYKKKRSKADVY